MQLTELLNNLSTCLCWCYCQLNQTVQHYAKADSYIFPVILLWIRFQEIDKKICPHFSILEVKIIHSVVETHGRPVRAIFLENRKPVTNNQILRYELRHVLSKNSSESVFILDYEKNIYFILRGHVTSKVILSLIWILNKVVTNILLVLSCTRIPFLHVIISCLHW